jgi:hypothetical protein
VAEKENAIRTKTIFNIMEVRCEQILNSLTHSALRFVFWHKKKCTSLSTSKPEVSQNTIVKMVKMKNMIIMEKKYHTLVKIILLHSVFLYGA